MNTKVTIKRIFLFYIILATGQLPAADLSVISLALSLVNLAQRYSSYLPALKEHLPEVKKYVPFHTLNGHKKPIIAGAVIIVLASIWLIKQKRKNFEERKTLEKKFELGQSNFIKNIIGPIIGLFNKPTWKAIWEVVESLNNLLKNEEKIQKERINKMKTTLMGNNYKGLELLVKTPSWFDRFFISHPGKLIDPNIKLTYGNKNKNPLNPQQWITPLQYIIQLDCSKSSSDKKLKSINILLANEARAIEEDHEYNDALHYAVKADKPDIAIIKRLIEANVHPDRPNKNIMSCLHLVSDIKDKETRKEAAKILVGHNLNKVAKILVGHDLNMEVTNKSEDTPLLYAVREGRVELVKLFLTNSTASIEQLDKFDNSILLIAIILAAEKIPNKPWTKIIDDLFEHPNISKITDLPKENGFRPIHFAVIYKNNDCIKQLIKQGVNITQETELTLEKGEKKIISTLQLACD